MEVVIGRWYSLSNLSFYCISFGFRGAVVGDMHGLVCGRIRNHIDDAGLVRPLHDPQSGCSGQSSSRNWPSHWSRSRTITWWQGKVSRMGSVIKVKNFKAKTVFLHFWGEVRRPNCNSAYKAKNTRQGVLRPNCKLVIKAKNTQQGAIRPNGRLGIKGSGI